MRDTSDEALKMQREIISKMPAERRFQMGIEMIQAGQRILENSLREQYPQASETELKVLRLYRYYGQDLTPSELEHCAQGLRHFWQR
jgi:hypothetical protein